MSLHSRRQVYFTFDFSGSDLKPIAVVNLECGPACKWVHVPVRTLPPAALPRDLADGCALKQVGPTEDVVTAALKRKVFLTKVQVENMLAAGSVARPKKGAKGGSVLKRDLVWALAKHYLGEELGEDSPEFLDIVNAVTYKGKAKLECPEAVLEAVNSMDTENQQAFKDLVLDARQEKEKIAQKDLEAVMEKKYEKYFAERAQRAEREKQAGRADAAAASSAPAAGAVPGPRGPQGPRERAPEAEPRRTGVTPASFKKLLPMAGAASGIYGKHEPKKWYRVEYPCSSADLCARWFNIALDIPR